jgi:hypothetical protein
MQKINMLPLRYTEYQILPSYFDKKVTLVSELELISEVIKNNLHKQFENSC